MECFQLVGGACRQGDYLLQVAVELVERLALAVGTRKAGHVSDVHTGVGIAFDDCGIRLHRTKIVSGPWSCQRPNACESTPAGCTAVRLSFRRTSAQATGWRASLAPGERPALPGTADTRK